MKAKTTPIIQIHHPLFLEKNIEVWVKLDYKRHTEIQGNKWHKLKLNVREAQKLNKHTLLTFGGAYSNHIASTAAMAKYLNLNSIGIIRGEELKHHPEKWSHTLLKAHQQGMQLEFLNRYDYRLKAQDSFLERLQMQYPDAFIIPEGGSNHYAVDGFQEFMQETNQQLPDWTHLFTAVGTGGTLAGMTKYANEGNSLFSAVESDKTKQIVGVAVLKNADYLKTQIKNWIGPVNSKNANQVNWELLTQYHLGGYAKQTDQLIDFITWFEQEYSIPLDPVYTCKMFYAFFAELALNKIPNRSKVLLIHTGGLQGRQPSTI